MERDDLSEKFSSPKAGLSAESSGNFAALVSETLVLDEAADQVASSSEISECPQDAEEADFKTQAGLGFNYINPGISQNIELQQLQGVSRHKLGSDRWKMPSRLYGSSRGFYRGTHLRASRTGVEQNHEIKEIHAAQRVNTNKVKNWKPKSENNAIVKFKVLDEVFPQDGHSKKLEVLIGSIPVTIESCNNLQVPELEGQDSDLALTEYNLLNGNNNEKICKDDNVQLPTNPEPRQNLEKSDDRRTVTAESCLPEYAPGNDICSLVADAKGSENLPFSSQIARDFLAQSKLNM